jgi:leucyl-tRNA synthetase
MPDQKYDHLAVEEKWLQKWEKSQLFCDGDLSLNETEARDKEYLLYAFAYPSGSGLHVGHVEPKTALDIQARFKRMSGKKVFFPVGWDAFGLPAENYAIKTGIHPKQTTKSAIDTFRGQVKRLAISYDWSKEIATNHPEYYRWTQWIFQKLYQKGLAYQGEGKVNWCPSCQTVLANEQVVNGLCERCDAQVIQKDLKQWYFKITAYQDELIDGLKQVDWPNPTKQQQINWIGRSKGLSIDFRLAASEQKLTVWTKFHETVFGTTFLVIAPEKFLQMQLEKQVPSAKMAEVQAYLDQAFKKTEEERKIGEKDKTGVDTGLLVTNPVNGEQVPLYIADYVLMNVGTGIVMGVPAHDERDFAFAKKYGLAIRQVVSYADQALNDAVAKGEKPFEGEGQLVNSAQFDGQAAWGEGKKAMAEWMIEAGLAKWQTTYKLRDWLISRQRYWGAPIPVVYDPEGQAHLVKEEHLPWLLPEDVDFKPTGESPLRSSKEFHERVERLYGKGWTPEYDTMDTFVDSSWYYLRYCAARDKEQFADKKVLATWMPVNLYLIGPEHIVLHLLYSRFFTKFLRDEGYLDLPSGEPFAKMRHQGMILGPDGRKMSKSKGNVINPDEIIKEYGADTLRVYEMFMGPLEADKPWNPRAVAGVARFLRKTYRLLTLEIAKHQEAKLKMAENRQELVQKLHWTIQKLSSDLPELKYNTAIAALMELSNVFEKMTTEQAYLLDKTEILDYIKLLAPLAPFMAEELYEQSQTLGLSKQTSVHLESWPKFDPNLLLEANTNLVIQVNGKVREQLSWPTEALADKEAILDHVKGLSSMQKWLLGKTIQKEIYVVGKVLNLVVV